MLRPAPRYGVSASCVAVPVRRAGVAGPVALDFLSQRLPVLARAQWAQRLAQGDVLDHAGQPLHTHSLCQPGSLIWYWREVPEEIEIPFTAQVLFQDEHLVVADKPHFLPMTPKGRYARHTLLAQLQRRLGLDSLVPMHRLDRETAGVVVFGVRPAERAAYQGLFRDRQVRKVYEAIAPWRPGLSWPQERRSRLAQGAHFMQRVEVVGEPNAHSVIELLAHNAHWGHYRLHPHTGQTHQLRVHMHALGLPLWGDRIYPVLQPEPAPGSPADFSAPLQLLAREIAFIDPLTGQARFFRSQQQLLALDRLYT